MTQIEGLFYDCLTILNKKELGKKAGTLVEKVNKVFSDNKKIKQALYPHFAFSVPQLRNEIAHNGITSSGNPSHLCSEIILDMYCVVHWACQLSDGKFDPIVIAYNKLIENEKTKNSVLQEKLIFSELFSSFRVMDCEFIKVLAVPDEYNDEIQFYKTLYKEKDDITISKIIKKVSDIVVSNDFWTYVKDDVLKCCDEHEKREPNDLIDFIRVLRNEFIPVLESGSQEKITCQEVSKQLKTFL